MLRSVLQQNGAVLITFVTGMVIARLLAPREVGVYGVAMAAVNIATAVKDFGISAYVISEPEHDEGLMRSAFGFTLVIAALLTAALIALAGPVASFYRDPALAPILAIVALGPLSAQLAFPAIVTLNRAMRFDILLAVGLAGACVQSAVAIGLAACGVGSASLAWGYIANGVTVAGGAALSAPHTLRIKPSLRDGRRLLAFGGMMSSTMAIGALAMSMPEIVIGRALGLADTALFTRAQNIVSIIRNGLFAALMRPMLPKFGALEAQGLSLAPIYLRVIEAVTGVAWPAYLLLAIWSEPLVRLLYGPAWTGSAPLIPALAVAHGLTLAVAPHYDVLIVKRRVQLLFACESGLFAFSFVSLLVGVAFGLIGVALALALGGVLFAGCYLVVLRGIVGFRVRELLGVWGRSASAAAGVAPIAVIMRLVCSDTPLGTLLGCAVSALAGMAAWTMVMRLTGHELDSQISAVAGRFLPPVWINARNGARL